MELQPWEENLHSYQFKAEDHLGPSCSATGELCRRRRTLGLMGLVPLNAQWRGERGLQKPRVDSKAQTPSPRTLRAGQGHSGLEGKAVQKSQGRIWILFDLEHILDDLREMKHVLPSNTTITLGRLEFSRDYLQKISPKYFLWAETWVPLERYK